tara:strand:- start:3060 stop:3920 length:861 start_codon:yes stop_codon:yes gene_type:complete
MKFNIRNRSSLNLSEIKPFLESFLPFAQKKMGFDTAPTISFISDVKNAEKPLGKTAFYNPNTSSVSIYTDHRHPKDIMRSLSHELVHHAQNCRGDFDLKPEMGEGYFQNDSYMREMEREAYELGNMCFRMWEETYKKQLQESIYYSTGDTKMSYKKWRNQEVNGRLMESWGYKTPKNEVLTESIEIQEQELDEAHCGRREDDLEEGYGMCPKCGMSPCICPVMEEEELEEGAKPDFLDLDKDGDKEESMTDAAKNAEEKELDETLIRKTIREAITKALKTRSNKED